MAVRPSPSLIFLLILTAQCVSGLRSLRPSDDSWIDYKTQYGKSYVNASVEQERRMTWSDNLLSILAHNLQTSLGLHTYRLALNQFADLEPESFRGTLLGGLLTSQVERTSDSQIGTQPPNVTREVNWVTAGVVTPVKNQGECGACWAFAAIATLESANAIKTKELVQLSEQNLIDCTWTYGNMGCIGGLMTNAYEYVMDYGIDTEQSYPYTAESIVGSCAYNPITVGSTESAYYGVPPGSELWLQVVVQLQGPVACGINANSFQFMFYSSGVFSLEGCSADIFDLNHALTVVGFGTTAEGLDYWLLKNSWGTSWGMGGYMMLERNANNMCGIATYCQFPTV